MAARLDLALAVAAGLLAGPLLAQPVDPVPAVPAAPAPALQRLTEGTLPIVACPGDADRGCVEVLFDGDQPPVACWTLPPFGRAAIQIETASVQQIGESTTRRMMISFYPLHEVPPATSATLHFAFPRPGEGLICDQSLLVQRPASSLALSSDLDLGVLYVELWGRVAGAHRTQTVFAALGQPAIGPLTVSSQTSLHAGDRQGSPVPVRLDFPAAASVTATRFAELTLVPGSSGIFPALGALSGQAWITGPQLVQPFALTVRAASQIGWISILAMLTLGILLGFVVHILILPRQALARARLDAERAFVAAARTRDMQRDSALASALDQMIDQQRKDIQAATDPTAIAQAVQQMSQGIATKLQTADARLQALAAEIAPPLAVLGTLPAVSELPAQPLEAWATALDKAQNLIEEGDLSRAEHLIDTGIAEAEKAAIGALLDFAGKARTAIRGLEGWDRDAAQTAFTALQAAGEGFNPAPDSKPADILTKLRDANYDLYRAVASGRSAISDVLRTQAAGAANSGFPNAAGRTEAILRDLERTPVAALEQLSTLVQDYQDQARKKGLASFEDLADVQPSGAEGGAEPVLLDEPWIQPPEPPALAIETDPRLPVAGRELAIRLMELPAGHVARIWTSHGSARFARQDDPPLIIFPLRPGPMQVSILLADAHGHVVTRQYKTLIIQPAPDHAIPALTTELRRAERLAIFAAMILSLLSGIAVFSVVPLTSWWGLLAPLLWGFFVNLNLPDAIQGLQARRDAVFKTLNIG